MSSVEYIVHVISLLKISVALHLLAPVKIGLNFTKPPYQVEETKTEM